MWIAFKTIKNTSTMLLSKVALNLATTVTTDPNKSLKSTQSYRKNDIS